MCVVGDEMAGKTTYVNSLLQLNQPQPKDDDRTPGLISIIVKMRELAKDLGGILGLSPHSTVHMVSSSANQIQCSISFFLFGGRR